MKIKSPCKDRLQLIQSVFDGSEDPDLLTDDEFVWLQDMVMQQILESKMKTGSMVFSEVEDGLLN